MRIYYLCLLYIYIYIKIQHVALRVLSFPPILTFPNSVSRPGAAQDSHSNSDSNSGWHHSNPPCASTTRTSTPWGKVEMMISSREGDDFQPGRGWFPAGKGVQKKLTKMLGSPDINVAIECSILVRQLKNAACFAGCKGKHASWLLKHECHWYLSKNRNANGKYTVLGIWQKWWWFSMAVLDFLLLLDTFFKHLTKLPKWFSKEGYKHLP